MGRVGHKRHEPVLHAGDLRLCLPEQVHWIDIAGIISWSHNSMAEPWYLVAAPIFVPGSFFFDTRKGNSWLQY